MPIQPSNLQVHWLEGNILLDKTKRSVEGVPDYNAIARLEKI
ncbi:molybdopterin-dependent oxidoreductase alpha subunit [Tolypothrix tenuis PCC 7101]|uniref:Molybdopterin-dependent oxidoreductase alpha subunit n=1 Tax=Tolypothrix tenuis PCC 7101 TaxID=231146 RepID=A0A1Z4MS19_9CYAN|nr:molybdopterin-dependent oxidoreductase alpha subunit [Tolypothrix tenuis PCC 7101]BAZ73218.1 molybdopterin-dependent oxidoreductase alpha subunit [Aulosira laxa NIES-50]